MQQDLSIRTDVRLAGRTLRYHTWPHIRPQTVGEHSWQVARLIMSICPQFQDVLLPHAIMHDTGEIRTGDLPYPIKKDHPDLGEIMDMIEHRAIADISAEWMLPKPEKLSAPHRWAFKLCEFIEMWEWALEESLMGNHFAHQVETRCLRVAGDMISEPPQEESQISASICRVISIRAAAYMQRRSDTWSSK